MNRPGLSVTAARRVIEIEEVLVAMIAPGERCGTSVFRISRLIDSSSVEVLNDSRAERVEASGARA